MPSSNALPNEILLEILILLRPNCQKPLDILLVSSDFYLLFSQLLYGQLEFRKIDQLTKFLSTFSSTSIPQPIRQVTVALYNDPHFGLYTQLRDFFSLCTNAPEAEVDDCGRVAFKSLKFRFHTHSQDISLSMIYDALVRVNPHAFTWIGPDPPHHFSAAIVPAALSYLLRALSTQSNLKQLTLSHVKFPDNDEILLLPRLPSLKTLTLSQVIFLRPDIIVNFLLNSDLQLGDIRLIDAYTQSIWGPRLRRSHIEAAARHYAQLESTGEDGDFSQMETVLTELLHRIQHSIVCQGKFERIIGGDRILSDSILV